VRVFFINAFFGFDFYIKLYVERSPGGAADVKSFNPPVQDYFIICNPALYSFLF